jgi:hypothetical protein
MPVIKGKSRKRMEHTVLAGFLYSYMALIQITGLVSVLVKMLDTKELN